MTTRLTSGFWVAAKLRQVQITGGYASVLVKGNDDAGAINLVLRTRDGILKLATAAMMSNDDLKEREFEWRDIDLDEAGLNAFIERELRFDRDQWFLECECRQDQFLEIFNVKKI
jgi:hypothetical protein